MARLRFPGRPGYRFGRTGLTYSRDEPSDALDRATRLIANIHRGLGFFHEIFGESDEDEEFLGFTKDEIDEATEQFEKSKLLLQELQKPISLGSKPFLRIDPTALRKEKLSQKDSKKLLETVINEGGAKKIEESVHSQVIGSNKKEAKKKFKASEEGNETENRKERPKTTPFKGGFKVKLRFGKRVFNSKPKTSKQYSKTITDSVEESADNDDDILYSLSPSKKSDNESKTRKQCKLHSKSDIVQKVPTEKKRRGRKSIQNVSPSASVQQSKSAKSETLIKNKELTKKSSEKDDKHILNAAKKVPVKKLDFVKKQFVLPTVSSRSSRKIKPNKRFIEEEYSLGIKGASQNVSNEDFDKTHENDVKDDKVVEISDEEEDLKTESKTSENVFNKGLVTVESGEDNLGIDQSVENAVDKRKKRIKVLSSTLKKSSKVSNVRRGRRPGKKRNLRKKSDEKIGMLDLPPIIKGKRERKPSNKLLQKWTDENEQKVHRQNIEATKRSGKTILQKAKLRLNQRTLNKSKQALVKSLKQEMGGEEETKSSDSYQSDVTSPPLRSLSIQISPLKKHTSPTSIAPKFGALSMPKGPKSGTEIPSEETITFGVKDKSSDDVISAVDLDQSRSDSVDLDPTLQGFIKPRSRCGICGFKFRDKSQVTPYCRYCTDFYKEHVRRVVEENVNFTCKKVRDEIGKCPTSVRCAYYRSKNVPPLKVFPMLCTSCRFERCSARMGHPEQYYASMYWSSDAPIIETEASQDNDTPSSTQKTPTRGSRLRLKLKKDTSSETPKLETIDNISNEPLTADDGNTAPTNESIDKITKQDMLTKRSPLKGLTRVSSQGVVVANTDNIDTNTESDNEAMKSEEATNASKVPGKSHESAHDESGVTKRTSGPRIKHVCRRASVALGKSTATFPDLTLSALPDMEKLTKAEGKGDDSEVANKAMASTPTRGKSSGVLSRSAQKNQGQESPRSASKGTKSRRCGKCTPCLQKECEKCPPCLDKKKFGGPGTMNMSCVERRCVRIWNRGSRSQSKESKEPKQEPAPIKQESGPVKAELDEKDVPALLWKGGRGKKRKRLGDESGVCGTDVSPSEKMARKLGKSEAGSVASSQDVSEESDSGSELVDVEGVDADEESDSQQEPSIKTVTKTLFTRPVGYRRHLKRRSQKIRPKSSLWYNDKDEMRSLMRQATVKSPHKRLKESPMRRKLAARRTGGEIKATEEPAKGRMRTKLPNLSGHVSQESSPKKNDATTDFMANKKLKEQAAQVRENRANSASEHLIKLDFKEDFDIDRAHEEGVALISNTPFCVRAVCLLCGSQGQQQLLYCNVCCEPFHWFCLEDGERPAKNQLDDWCCPRCQFCHVCAKQNNLLKCTKCGDTYHPGCLGPNYPTKPTQQNVWLCTRCVKCRSCSRTTPGDKPSDQWTHNFALCQQCGLLIDKGNFCPVCHKCYSDDDWEIKMIQCESCENWVHAKCENLSDEMYEIFSLLPEDTPFKCRVCAPGETRHQDVIMAEMSAGFKIIMENLMSAKNANSLLPIGNVEESLKALESDMMMERRGGTPERTVLPFQSTSYQSIPPISDDLEKIKSTMTKPNEPQSEALKTGIDNEKHSGTDLNTSHVDVETCDGSPMEVDQSSGTNTEEHKTNEGCFKAPVDRDHVLPPRQLLRLSVEESRSNRATPSPVSMVSMESTDSIPTDTSSDDHCDHHHKPTATIVHSSTKITPATDDNTGSQPALLEADQNKPVEQSTQEPLRRSLRRQKTETKVEEDENDDTSQRRTTNVEMLQSLQSVSMATASREAMGPGFSTDLVRWGDEKKEYPRSLLAVQAKFENSGYTTVDEFCSDIVRILRYNLQQGTCIIPKKKSDQSTRNIFISKMETCFPWYNVNTSTLWQYDRNLPDGMLPDAVLPPSEDHTYAQWLERNDVMKSPQLSPFKRVPYTPHKHYSPSSMGPRNSTSPRASPRGGPYLPTPGGSRDWQGDTSLIQGSGDFGVDDVRKCGFCGEFGDKRENDAGRLLHTGLGEWVHVNCALWSAEVFEEVDGTLQNVFSALSRGRQLICNVCGKKGATVGCCAYKCVANFHMICALQAGCIFQEDKKVFCREHFLCAKSRMDSDKFGVLRRACVDLNNRYNKLYKQGVGMDSVFLLVGSMCLESLGHLENPLSDMPNILLPVNYCVSRVYWSTKDPRRRCMYSCRISKVTPEVLTTPVPARDLTVTHDATHPNFNLNLHLKYTSMQRRPSKESDTRRKSSLLSTSYDDRDLTRSMYSTDDTPMSDNTGTSAVFSPGYSASRWLKLDRPHTSSTPSENLSAKFSSAQKLLQSGNQNEPQEKKQKSDSTGDGLIEMVNRLNRAASKSRRSRSGSEGPDRSSREGSLERSSGRSSSTLSVKSPTPERLSPARPFDSSIAKLPAISEQTAAAFTKTVSSSLVRQGYSDVVDNTKMSVSQVPTNKPQVTLRVIRRDNGGQLHKGPQVESTNLLRNLSELPSNPQVFRAGRVIPKIQARNPSIMNIARTPSVIQNKPAFSETYELPRREPTDEECCLLNQPVSNTITANQMQAPEISANLASQALGTLSHCEEDPVEIQAAFDKIAHAAGGVWEKSKMQTVQSMLVASPSKLPNPVTQIESGTVMGIPRSGGANSGINSILDISNAEDLAAQIPCTASGLVALSANETSELLNDVKGDNSFNDETEFNVTEANEIIQSLAKEETRDKGMEVMNTNPSQNNKPGESSYKSSLSNFLTDLPKQSIVTASPTVKHAPFLQHQTSASGSDAGGVCNLRQPMDEPSGFDLLDPDLMDDIASITPLGPSSGQSQEGLVPQLTSNPVDMPTTSVVSTSGNVSKTDSSIPQLDGMSDDKPMTSSGSSKQHGGQKKEQTIREKIMQKIKAESLARRSPTDQGPTKCQKCKRVYRTVESYNVHVESCDFVVSSDEEEEDNESVESAGEPVYQAPVIKLRVPRAKKVSMSSRGSRSTPSPPLPGSTGNLDENKDVTVTYVHPDNKISNRHKATAKHDDDPDYCVEKDIVSSRRSSSRSTRRSSQDSQTSSKSPVSTSTIQETPSSNVSPEAEPQIMYQGQPLVRTPFKRKRGRPRVHKPVLVVPPQPRPRTVSGSQLDEEEEDDAMVVPDETDTSGTVHDPDLDRAIMQSLRENVPRPETRIELDVDRNKAMPRAISTTAISAPGDSTAPVDKSFDLRTAVQMTDRGVLSMSTGDSRFTKELMISDCGIEAYQTSVQKSLPVSSFYKGGDQADSKGNIAKVLANTPVITKINPTITVNTATPGESSSVEPQNSSQTLPANNSSGMSIKPDTGLQYTQTTVTSDVGDISPKQSGELSKTTLSIPQSPTVHHRPPNTQQQSSVIVHHRPSGSNLPQPSTSTVHHRPAANNSAPPSSPTVHHRPAQVSMASQQKMITSSQGVITSTQKVITSPHNMTSPPHIVTSPQKVMTTSSSAILAASRSASASPRSLASSPGKEQISKPLIEALENKLGQRIKVLTVSKDELLHLKKSLDRQGVSKTPHSAIHPTPMGVSTQALLAASDNANRMSSPITIDSDSNPSPAVSQSNEPFSFPQASQQITTIHGGSPQVGNIVVPRSTPNIHATPPQVPSKIIISNMPGSSAAERTSSSSAPMNRTPTTFVKKRSPAGPPRVTPSNVQFVQRHRKLASKAKDRPEKVSPNILRGGSQKTAQSSPRTLDGLISSIIASQSPRQHQTPQQIGTSAVNQTQMQSPLSTNQPQASSYVALPGNQQQQILSNQQLLIGNQGQQILSNQPLYQHGNQVYTISNQPTPVHAQTAMQQTLAQPVVVQNPSPQMIQTSQQINVNNTRFIVTNQHSAAPTAVIRTPVANPQVSNFLGQTQSPTFSQPPPASNTGLTVNTPPQMSQNISQLSQIVAAQQSQIMSQPQSFASTQLAKAAADILQNAKAGTTYTIRTPSGDFQVISSPPATATNAPMTVEQHMASPQRKQISPRIQQIQGVTSNQHPQQNPFASYPTSVQTHQTTGQMHTVQRNHNIPVTANQTAANISRNDHPRNIPTTVVRKGMADSYKGIRSAGHHLPKYTSVHSKTGPVIVRPENLHRAQKRMLESPHTKHSDAKRRKLLDEQRRLTEISVQELTQYSPKTIPYETARAMQRILKRGNISDDLRGALIAKLDAFRQQRNAEKQKQNQEDTTAKKVDKRLFVRKDDRVRPALMEPEVRNDRPKPVKSEEQVREMRIARKAKRTRKEPLRENIRQDTGTYSVAHPLIHATRRGTQLPEPAVEEEVKDVPLYSIFGQKGAGGLPLRHRKDRPHLRFEIESDDGFKVHADSWDDAWKAVVDKVQDARANARMKQLSFSGVNGMSMFGLCHSAVVYLVEQLFGAHTCKNYSFKYHHYEREEEEEEPEENPTGCARSEPFVTRKPYEMFSFLLSKYRKKPKAAPASQKDSDITIKSQRRATSLELPLAMRFRALKLCAKDAVGVYRSGIHGRGLFCKRDIDAGEMIIEYTGEVIRSMLTDKREKYYESKGIGCYMFRIDEDCVIDATLRGSAARFINHSCEPNCYSKIVSVENTKHIVIFAMKPIKRGEELTYDYKFPIEDVKIPCTCNFKKCRKYLN